ncbi:MAG: 6-carboxytetrahydropterin synthase QueD [Deltaproteobacteria bacterium]|nr:MAG: 6-carboxytetrahydropterin synthase QueD [Deltaproteobacteria bacterium]
MYELRVRAWFSAAHNLRQYRGKCEALHGHNYRVEVAVRGKELGAGGMLMDFGDLKAILRDILGNFDHRYLNEVPPFDVQEPSCENIARWISEEVQKRLPPGLKVFEVTVWESEDTASSFLAEP